MDTLPIIQCNHLTVRIGKELVLEDFDLKVHKGKHLVLQGPSGSGKSTLLKVLLGFRRTDRGTLSFRGNQGKGNVFKGLRAHAAWLPQDLNMGDETVEEVMKKPFQFKANTAGAPDRDTLRDIIQQLGLATDDLLKPFPNLSTGQRQRVGVAVCYLLDKPVLLLDEPTSALDEVSKRKAADLLLGDGKTVVSTSHDPFWIGKADHIIEIA